jgi:DNA-directed RNA polymerase subunit RPC12/RpoP
MVRLNGKAVSEKRRIKCPYCSKTAKMKDLNKILIPR